MRRVKIISVVKTSERFFDFAVDFFWVTNLYWQTLPFHAISPATSTQQIGTRLVESRGAVSSEDLLAGSLGNAVGQRELEVLGEELLDVRAADVVGLGDLDDLEDLQKTG